MNKMEAELTGEDKEILIKYAKGKNNLIELGTYYGGGSKFFKEHANKVTTIDLFENFNEIQDETNLEHYKLSFEKQPRLYNDIRKELEPLGLTVIQNSTYEEAKNHEDVDMIFIDADHSYLGVKMDFESWFPKIIQGGIIAFHDSNPGNGWGGIPKYMQELKIDPRLEFLELKGSVSVYRKN